MVSFYLIIDLEDVLCTRLIVYTSETEKGLQGLEVVRTMIGTLENEWKIRSQPPSNTGCGQYGFQLSSNASGKYSTVSATVTSANGIVYSN